MVSVDTDQKVLTRERNRYRINREGRKEREDETGEDAHCREEERFGVFSSAVGIWAGNFASSFADGIGGASAALPI